MSEKKPVLELRNVTFCYPSVQIPAVEDICLSVYPSEIVVLCGQSGCGKSTLLRHMKKNQIPFGSGSGNIFFDGADLEKMDNREAAGRIGFVGQEPDAQIVTDTVWHELAFGLENLGVPGEEIRRRTAETAEYLGMGPIFRKSVWELSGGQKQLLNLASVLVMRPDVLILDEPTAQMDPISANRFIQTLQRLNQDFGTAIVLSEQRLEEVLPVSDKIYFMHRGKIVSGGPVSACSRLLAECEEKIGEALPVKEALPVAVRAFAACEPFERQDTCPVSVREGRNWLETRRREESLSAKPFEKDISVGRKKRKDIVLQARHVGFSYNEGKRVLDDFSVRVEAGCFFVLLGGNGSGKTTALKLLSGVYKKCGQGRITRRGRTLYLAQNPQSLFTEVTAEEELAEALSRNEDSREVERMLAFLDLERLRDSNPMDLSGGEKQRLALGKILLRRPEVLLLDEPTKGLDAAFKDKLSNYFSVLRESGVTIVMASHDLEFCAANATHTGLMFDGSLISEGPVREFFAGNAYYTTAAARMADGILPDCLMCRDIVRQVGEEGVGG